MPSRQQVLLPLLITGCALAIAVLLWLNRPLPQQQAIVQRPLIVEAAQAVYQDIRVQVRAQGNVTPRTETALIAEVAGKVVGVSAAFKAGGFFRAGDALLQIDDRNYQAELKRAAAAVASAESALAEEKGRSEVAYQDWLKYRSGVKRSPEAEALALRKPQLIDAQARLDAARAELDYARIQLERTTLRAPYDGLLRSKAVDIGQYVNVGGTLGHSYAVDYAEVRLALPESKLGYLNLPTMHAHGASSPAVTFYASVGDQLHQWRGRLVRTEGVFDAGTRVLFAVAQVDDPYGLDRPRQQALRFGSFVDAAIDGRRFEDLVALPRHILRAGNRIWVIDADNRLRDRQVEILTTEGPHILVRAGLEPGERVCLSLIPGAVSGREVEVGTVTPSDALFEELTEAAATDLAAPPRALAPEAAAGDRA